MMFLWIEFFYWSAWGIYMRTFYRSSAGNDTFFYDLIQKKPIGDFMIIFCFNGFFAMKWNEFRLLHSSFISLNSASDRLHKSLVWISIRYLFAANENRPRRFIFGHKIIVLFSHISGFFEVDKKNAHTKSAKQRTSKNLWNVNGFCNQKNRKGGCLAESEKKRTTQDWL